MPPSPTRTRLAVLALSLALLCFPTLRPATAQPSASAFVPASPELPAATRMHKDLAYVAGGHERQRLDLYVPAGKGKHPVILFLHSGAYGGGDKSDPAALRYVERGYAVASANYRLAEDAAFPAQIEDARAAVRWLRAHADEYGLDAEHIGAWGVAQGGHLASLLGTATTAPEWDGLGEHRDVSSAVQAVVTWYGPTDFARMDERFFPGHLSHDAADSPESRLLGGPVQEKLDLVATANPIRYVGAHTAPFLIVHGQDDPQIPHHQSVLLLEALLEAGRPVGFLSMMGIGHGGEAFSTSEITDNMNRFFERHLKP